MLIKLSLLNQTMPNRIKNTFRVRALIPDNPNNTCGHGLTVTFGLWVSLLSCTSPASHMSDRLMRSPWNICNESQSHFWTGECAAWFYAMACWCLRFPFRVLMLNAVWYRFPKYIHGVPQLIICLLS